MKCSRCQSDNPAEADFCIECGALMEFHCPKCGAIIPATGKFCKECGCDLREAKPPLVIDYSQPLSYTPKHLADRILAARTTIEGERKQVTVLFADVKGFTSISEKLDPEEVQTLISECLVFFTEEIHRYEGAVAQFLGDGVMALFGAPIAHEDAPQRALHAALAIQERLREYSEKLKKQGIDFNMRIGLNTGLVVVGRIGDDLTMEYTAMGDTVNLASRMESTAQPGTIQVSENTYRLTEGYFEFKPLGEIELKGKKEPVKAYQLLGVGQAKTRLGVSVARGLTPFVGRQKEIEHLKDCYARVKEGQGQVVGIVGEPGVGKSRLLLQLRSVLPPEEYSYLEGDCLHYGGSIAYLPFLDMLRAYFDFAEGEQESLVRIKMAKRIASLDEKLQGILPPLQDVLSLKVQDEEYLKLEPQQRREQVFEAIRTLLIRESLNRPLVLAIDDLQWIDKTSEEFLTYFIDGLANTHILLILLYRPEYTPVWVSKGYYSQIRVDQLPTGGSSDLIQAILEGGEVATDLRTLILTRASGNPLFIEEFTRTLLERGYIQRKDGHYVLTVKPSDIQVPDTVQGIIAARIDRLEAKLKQTMQVASVIGRDFPFRILQTITGMKQELKLCLLNLQELEFIYEKSLFPELEYIFKHALTQEVAYNSLLLKRRKEIHERIGQAIENLYPDRLEEFCELLAHHYSRGENWEKAYQYLKLSGDKATRNYAKWEAIGFYREAIGIVNKQPDTEENKRKGIEVRLLMTTPIRYVGYPEGSLEVLEEGERLSRELGDEKSLAQFLSLISFYCFMKGDSRRGLQYAEECFREAERAQDVELMAAIGMQLSVSYVPLGEYQKVAEVAAKAIAMIERAGRQSDSFNWGFNVYAALHPIHGLAMASLGDFQLAEALCEKGLRFAQEVKDLYCIGHVECFYANICTIRGDGKKAIAHAENALRIFEETQFLTQMGTAWYILGYGYYFLGELGTAREHVKKGLETDRAVGLTMMWSLYYFYMGEIDLASCDWESARRCADEGLKLAQTHGEKEGEGWLSCILGRALAKADPSQAARGEEYILQGIKILDELKVRPYSSQGYLYLGEFYADTGQRENALKSLRKAEGMFQEMGMEYWLRRTQKILERLKN
jgi:class 3 adenylate cyclase/tetratricopeptide (TPR) repeat protein